MWMKSKELKNSVQNYVESLKIYLHWIYKMYKIVCILWKGLYVEYIELCVIFEKLCTLNIQNCMQSLRNIYIEFTTLKNWVYWIYERVHKHWKLCTFNVWNCVHSLKKCICKMYRIMFILWKIVHIECSELCTFFEKLCILTIKYCVRWMYKIERFCPLNIQTCVNS